MDLEAGYGIFAGTQKSAVLAVAATDVFLQSS